MAEYVRDDFARTVASGFGTSVVGGAWSEGGLAGGTTSVSPSGGGRGIFAMTADATVHERLAAATPALDQIISVAYRVPALDGLHTLRVAGRVDAASAIDAPTGLYAQLVIGPDGGMVVSIGALEDGVATSFGETEIEPGSYIAGRMWRLEMEIISGTPEEITDPTPTDVRVRTWDTEDGQPPPDQADGWLMFEAADYSENTLTYDGVTLADPVDTPLGPTVAGVYQLTLGRTGASAGTSWEIGDVYATDPVRPVFVASMLDDPPTSNAVQVTTVDTGDPVAWEMDWGDGATPTTGPGPYTHGYAILGYFTATYTVMTRWGTPWYDTDGILAAYRDEPLPTLPGQPPVLPIITIDGVHRCEFFRATWRRGSTFWVDGLEGNSATFDLRGRIPISKGARINVALPSVSGGQALWRGYVDNVHYSLHPVSAENVTQVTAYDVAAHLGRRHISRGRNLPEHRLPARLNDLVPHRGIKYRNRYGSSVVPASRWARLKKKAYKRDKLRQRTYLEMVNEALGASIAFAYCREDGTVMFAPWDAPDALSLVIKVDLDGDLDCPTSIETDRRAEGGIINRWTVGDGDRVDKIARGSVDKYGEQQYLVEDGILVRDRDLVYGRFFDALKHPHSAPVAVVPIRDIAQHALLADPVDIAQWEGRLYTIMGVQHDVELSTWDVTLELDRNPWEIHGLPGPPTEG